MSLITVMLADDHPILRHGLRSLLEGDPAVRVIGETGDGLEAATLVDRLRPDVLVLDLEMPSLNGLEVSRRVSKRLPQTRIIILSMYANEAYVLGALRNGASAYVLKGGDPNELLQAVQEVIAGRRYLSPPLSELAINAYTEKAQALPLDPYETLTTREREVLSLASEGYSNIHIAERLFISGRTVETHRANLMRKLHLHSQTELLRYALQRGMTSTQS